MSHWCTLKCPWSVHNFWTAKWRRGPRCDWPRIFQISSFKGHGPFYFDPGALLENEKVCWTIYGSFKGCCWSGITSSTATNPRFGRLVETPTTHKKLASCQFLHPITRHGIKNVKERFIGKWSDFGHWSRERSDTETRGDHGILWITCGEEWWIFAGIEAK